MVGRIFRDVSFMIMFAMAGTTHLCALMRRYQDDPSPRDLAGTPWLNVTLVGLMFGLIILYGWCLYGKICDLMESEFRRGYGKALADRTAQNFGQ